jgi:hypothetical protein
VLDGLMLLQAKVQGQKHKLIDRIDAPALARQQK